MKKNAKKILVVDDDESVLATISRYLTGKGYDIETAITGREAIEKSKNQFFDLAVLDIKLPDMDGTDLLTKMHETEPRMKKIILTGYPSMENAVESVNKEADAYIIKPIDLRKLREVIEEKLADQQRELKMDRKKLVAYIESRDKEHDT